MKPLAGSYQHKVVDGTTDSWFVIPVRVWHRDGKVLSLSLALVLISGLYVFEHQDVIQKVVNQVWMKTKSNDDKVQDNTRQHNSF